MAKRGLSTRGQIASGKVQVSQANFQAQLNVLLKQQKYRQALDEIEKARRSHPDLTFSPPEGDIWLLRGKQEFQKEDFKQAERSLRRSLELGLTGEPHYWLAKCLLTMDRLDAAIDLLRPAFDEGTLPKDYSICYAKLLLLKGDVATVEQLLSKKKARFPAAQQHWLRGVMALQANQPEAALEYFQKIKNPPTLGDRLDIWLVYIQQALENWDAAALKLGLGIKTSNMWGFAKPVYNQHPLLQRLALMQHLKTGHPPLETMEFKLDKSITEQIMDVLSVVEFLEENNPHDAAHTFVNMERRSSSNFPELASLRPVLLTLAGQQAMTQGELSCAEEFWKPLITEQPFNPQLVVNLLEVLRAIKNHQEEQQLLTRLLRWLEQQPKKHPEDWPEEKYHRILAHAHCRLADNWMAMGRKNMALAEVQKAERIYPQSPEVIGRQGLSAAIEGKHEIATQLLTQALEAGCRYAQVYTQLVESWKHLGKPDTALQVRRRFGKQFGDLNPEAEVVIPPWIDALSTGDYAFFSRMVQESSKTPDPPLRACQIFVEAVQSEPNSGGRVSLNQAKAVKQWDTLLKPLSPQEQIVAIEAIALSILLFAKREKGIAALINQQILKLHDLGATEAEAREAHLVVLSLKERDTKKIQTPLRIYLDSMPQPGNALAQIQFKRRRFAQDPLQYPILRPFIEDALRREPQNPLLLLAKATTYLPKSPTYEESKQQGFEIARRLQDAKALQAFREEQSYIEFKATQEFLPDPDQLDNLSDFDIDNILEQMIRKMFGSQIPPSELKRMLPELKRMAMEDMPDFDDEEDDDFFGFSGFSPSPARKKKRGFGKR